jgi:hypothetical protein
MRLSLVPSRNRLLGLAAITGLLTMLLVPSCHRSASPTEPDPTPLEKKAWTMLLYDDADFTSAFDPLDSFAENTNAGANVHVLVLQDREDGPAVIWSIDQYHHKIRAKEMGEVNMGSESTLSDFISFAKKIYPSDRIMISFYDHGGGWQGACWDATSRNDCLSMDEMKRGIDGAGGVDVVMFSAPCLMGAVESAYELRSSTQVYIGSANTSGYCFWWDPMKDICSTIESNPTITISDLGCRIVASIKDRSIRWQSQGWDKALTMAAIRMDRMPQLAAAIDSLSLEYLADVPQFKRSIDSVLHSVQTYSTSYVDLGSLMDNLMTVETREPLRAKLESVRRALAETVIAECHGTDCPESHGLNIFLPLPPLQTASRNYENQGLDFASDTHWAQLFAYYSTTPKTGQRAIAVPYLTSTNGFRPRISETHQSRGDQ